MSGQGIGPVDLVEVDVIRAEAAKRLLDLVDDPAPGVALLVRVVRIVTHLAVHLRREHDRIPPPLEGLSDDLFRFPTGVHVGRVDEVDACVESAVDDPDPFVMIGVRPTAEHHGAEAIGADLDACGSECAVAHGAHLTERPDQPGRGSFGRPRIRSPTMFLWI